MIIPFIPEDLFKINDNIHPQFDGEVIIIDDIFQNFSEILDICYNVPVEKWKSSSDSRNFKDYYDCRLMFLNWWPDQNKLFNRLDPLLNLTKSFYNVKETLFPEPDFSFNYFKHLKKDISKNLQHHPHYDDYYNVIFYLDSYENGGTAIYENVPLENQEEDNLFYDISNLKIKQIIKSKPNRCVIFPGHQLHGGYIEDHNKYYYNWRVNLVNFFSLQPRNGNN